MFFKGFRIRLLSYKNFVAYDGHGVIGIFFFFQKYFFYSYSRTLKFVDFNNFNNQKIWGGLLISEKMRSIGYQRDTYV